MPRPGATRRNKALDPTALVVCPQVNLRSPAVLAGQRRDYNKIRVMYIYADESGHSGRKIFNEPSFYFQGAIISETDTEPLLHEVAEKYKAEYGVEKLHANEILPHIAERIASAFLSLLDKTNWIFHITAIEKPYLSTTKFVDSLFDSYENRGARWLWYNHEFFRHSLCCLFDDLLLLEDKKSFWQSYLADDFDGIGAIVKTVLYRLEQIPLDKRLYQVSSEGLQFALKYPEEITLMANRTKKSYKGHTPNMVAFSSLIQAVHKFCKEYNTIPETFVHDIQSEFGSTMKEYHTLYAKLRAEHSESGIQLDVENTDYNLGQFSLTPSKQLASLQAVDLFLWLSQRNDKIKSQGLKNKLMEVTEPFYISRGSSEMIRAAWAVKISNRDLSEEELEMGKQTIAKMEDVHKTSLKEFNVSKIKGK